MENNFVHSFGRVLETILVPEFFSIKSFEIETKTYKVGSDKQFVYTVHFNLDPKTGVNDVKQIKNETRNLFRLFGPSMNEDLIIKVYPGNID